MLGGTLPAMRESHVTWEAPSETASNGHCVHCVSWIVGLRSARHFDGNKGGLTFCPLVSRPSYRGGRR